MRNLAALVAGALIPGVAASADDDVHPMAGVDLGVGAMYLRNETANISSDVHAGVVFGAQLGAVVTPTLALCVRLLALRGGATNHETVLTTVTTTFAGGRAEYRPTRRWTIASGVGLGLFDDPRRAAFAVDVGVSFGVWARDAHEIDVSLESTGAFQTYTEAHDARIVLNAVLLVGYRLK